MSGEPRETKIFEICRNMNKEQAKAETIFFNNVVLICLLFYDSFVSLQLDDNRAK